MNRIVKTIASTALFGMLATTAQAVTFSFAALGGPDVSSLEVTSDGITVTITAGVFGNINVEPSIINYSNRLVDPLNQGLGVHGGNDSSSRIDGEGGNDVLVFTFSQEVRIDQIMFGHNDGNDDFTFGLVDGTVFDRLVPETGEPQGPDALDTVALASVLAGGIVPSSLAFGIGAIQNNDNFSIVGLSVTAIPSVPLPASLPLLLGALGVGAMASRRRKTRST